MVKEIDYLGRCVVGARWQGYFQTQPWIRRNRFSEVSGHRYVRKSRRVNADSDNRQANKDSRDWNLSSAIATGGTHIDLARFVSGSDEATIAIA